MEDRRSAKEFTNKKIVLIICRFIIHLAVHKMIGVVVYQVIYAATAVERPLQLFNYHVLFSVLGYQLLLVEAIMSFNKESSWVRNLPRPTVRLIHLTLGATGSLFAFTGPLLMMIKMKARLKSAHGICGLLAMLSSVVTAFNGILTYFSPHLRNKLKPATIKAIHTVSGMFSITMGLTTLCIGINKDVFAAMIGNDAQLVSTLTSCVILILIYVLWHPVLSMFGYIQNMRTTEL